MHLKGSKYYMYLESSKITEDDDALSIILEIINRSVMIFGLLEPSIERGLQQQFRLDSYEYVRACGQIESTLDEMAEQMFEESNVLGFYDIIYSLNIEEMIHVYTELKKLVKNSEHEMSIVEMVAYYKVTTDLAKYLNDMGYFDQPLIPSFSF